MNSNGVRIRTGKRDIDRFEEKNESIPINVFEPDDCLNENRIILQRDTKIRNVKYKTDLLKVIDEVYHYALAKNKKQK